MNDFEGYSFADLSNQQIEKINETQNILKSVNGEDIVLIAYKKN